MSFVVSILPCVLFVTSTHYGVVFRHCIRKHRPNFAILLEILHSYRVETFLNRNREIVHDDCDVRFQGG